MLFNVAIVERGADVDDALCILAVRHSAGRGLSGRHARHVRAAQAARAAAVRARRRQPAGRSLGAG